jgi:hypothetical protein
MDKTMLANWRQAEKVIYTAEFRGGLQVDGFGHCIHGSLLAGSAIFR